MKTKVLLLTLLLIILSACSGTNYDPVSIDYNVDSCDTCNMGITDEQASAQVIAKDGTPSKFDDIGCLVVYMQEHKNTFEKSYVHDHQSSKWIEMNTAYFVHSHENETPMSYGIIAFSTKEDAQKWQQDHSGELYSNDDLLQANMKELKKDTNKTHSH